jgi:hypothetical protein
MRARITSVTFIACLRRDEQSPQLVVNGTNFTMSGNQIQ